MNEFIVAALICIAVVAFGDLVSYWTKAILPSMAVALITYLILVWFGMPKTYPDTAGFSALGDFVLIMLVVHLGTSVPPSEYIRQIRSVLVALAAVVGGLICTVGIGGLIFGFDRMLAGAGACCGGGCISGIAAIGKLNELGLTALLAVPTIMICVVDPLGQPIASFVLRKYAMKLQKDDAYINDRLIVKDEQVRLTKDGVPFGSEDNPSNRITAWIPKNLEADGVILFELTLAAAGAVFMENVTNINNFLWAFLIGVLGCAIGFFRMNLLDRSHSYGLCMTILIAYLFTSMNEITPQSLLASLGPVAGLIILSAIGLGLGGGIAGKLLGYDPILSAAAGIGIMFLFPGILIVSTEVSNRNSRNPEEREYMYQHIAPSMFIVGNSGFLLGLGVTVTVLLPLLAR